MEEGEEKKEEDKETLKVIEKSERKSEITEKLRKNPWILSTIVLGALALIFLVGSFTGALTGKVISEDKAGDYLVDYLSSVGYEDFEVKDVKSEGSLYLIETSYEDENVPFYVTKSGYIIGNSLVSIIPLTSSPSSTPSDSNVQDIPKSDKPKVELFVMTHCPYGTQAEKGVLPVFELLGNKIDAKIRFVHYFMHEQPGQEPDETPRQVCIREEQTSKYYDYLECFLEDGDAERCLTKTGIDKTKLSSCLSGKADDYYQEDSGLSEGYGVGGSPTLVINGEIVSSSRSPSAYLDTICQSFTDDNVPEECGESLSSASPSPGFGVGTSSGSSAAQC